MAMTPPEGIKVEVTPDQRENPQVQAEKGVLAVLKEKATAFGKRLMGVTDSPDLLPVEKERLMQMKNDADAKLAELYKKADTERRPGDNVMGEDLIASRYDDFRSFFNRMKRFFPNDLEVWDNMNVYFASLDKYSGSIRFTDVSTLKELESLGRGNLPLMKYSFLALANLGEQYAHYFFAHAERLGKPEQFSEIYGLVQDYAQKNSKVSIQVEELDKYINRRLNNRSYR